MSFEIKSLDNADLGFHSSSYEGSRFIEKTYQGTNLGVLSVELAPRIESYFKLISRFFFLFLSIFQLPFVFILFYSKKLIKFSQLCEKRKYIFFFCILFSAFISPPDILSQSILCFFAYIIYEFIILIGCFYEPVRFCPSSAPWH
jgi:Sec-independent protein secretion pathway component TatC